MANGPSLNDCLLKGPSFNQLIFDLLVRFRQYKVALVADLENAFLVEEADRDVLSNDTSEEFPEPVIYRFRVVFQLIEHNLVEGYPTILYLEEVSLQILSLIYQTGLRRLLQPSTCDDIIIARLDSKTNKMCY